MNNITFPRGKYLLAISGGPDSMALLNMCRIKKKYIEVAHVNYHKRRTANRDEKIVKDYCLKYNIIFHKKDIKNYKNIKNFQAYAREERYIFFNEICKKNNLKGVLVGQHRDDFLETYLMQKEKNLDVDYFGLSSFINIKGVDVYRPFINLYKNDLIDYCHKNNIRYGIDESNLSNKYTRNRIRHEILENMNKKEKNNLYKEAININIEKNNRIKIAKSYLVKEEYEIKEFINIPYISYYLKSLFKGKSDKYIKELLKQLKEAKKAIFNNDKYYLVKEYEKIYFFEIPDNYKYIINDYSEIKNIKNKYFKIRKNGRNKEGVTVVDDDFPITIRTYIKGDEIRMLYGTKKINRFFIDNKINYKERITWPIILNSDGDIILVPGIGCNIKHYTKKHNMFVIRLL